MASKKDLNYNIDFRFKSSNYIPSGFVSKLHFADYLLERIGADNALGPIWDYLEKMTEYEQVTDCDYRESLEEVMAFDNARIARAFPGMDYLGMEIKTNKTDMVYKEVNGIEELVQPLEFEITLRFKADRQHAETAIHKFLDKAMISYNGRRKVLDDEGLYYFYNSLEIKGYVEDGEVLEHFNGGVMTIGLQPKDRRSYYRDRYFTFFYFEGEDLDSIV